MTDMEMDLVLAKADVEYLTTKLRRAENTIANQASRIEGLMKIVEEQHIMIEMLRGEFLG